MRKQLSQLEIKTENKVSRKYYWKKYCKTWEYQVNNLVKVLTQDR